MYKGICCSLYFSCSCRSIVKCPTDNIAHVTSQVWVWMTPFMRYHKPKIITAVAPDEKYKACKCMLKPLLRPSWKGRPTSAGRQGKASQVVWTNIAVNRQANKAVIQVNIHKKNALDPISSQNDIVCRVWGNKSSSRHRGGCVHVRCTPRGAVSACVCVHECPRGRSDSEADDRCIRCQSVFQ